MRRGGKSRHKFWVRAVIVGLLLTGEVHLFSAEILHHHTEVARICRIEHQGGPYLHVSQDLSPLCPVCQIVRNGSVRPAVQSIIQKPDQESAFEPVTRQRQYSPIFTVLLLARGPPVS